MLQRPWLAWFFSNVAATISLLVWGTHAWPPETPFLLRGSILGVLQGAALLCGAWLGARWARRGRMHVSFVPMCMMLATLSGATALTGLGTPPIIQGILQGTSVLVALGQAGMLVALVHAPASDAGLSTGDLGQTLAVQMGAATIAACICCCAPALGWEPDMLLGVAALCWAQAAALFAWMHKTAVVRPAIRTASVSMASLLRHRRWPLLAVAAICGLLAACTPTLWMQSLQCLSGLQQSAIAAPILMLLGYGCGAKVAASVAQRPATVRLALAITLLGCAGFFLLGMIHFNALPQHIETLTRVDASHPWRRSTLEVLLTAMVVLPMSVSTGACLPLVAGAVGNGAPASANTMIKVLQAYGAGMVGGAALVPALAQYVGLEAIMRAAALLYAFAALVSSQAATPQRKVVRSLDVAALATALAIAIWPRWTVQDVQWQHFRGAQAVGSHNGLHYVPKLDNMRPHAPRSALLEDQSST